jgi:hypothetical protein
VADNVAFTDSVATYAAAADEVTYSGDTAKIPVARLVHVSGSEGAKTVTEIVGTAGSPGTAVLTVQGVGSGTAIPVSDASGSLTVDNAGTFAVQVSSVAAGDNNIGNVDIASIAAGDNNIGNVDIASIAAGDNNIGNVDVATLPADPLGANADAASTVGGTGSLSAKLRLMTTQLDAIQTATEAFTAGTGAVVDDADFSDGVSTVMPIGAVAESASPTTVTEGDFGGLGMTLNRALKTSEHSPANVSIYGSAGSAAAPVVSVQGIASMTPLQVEEATVASINHLVAAGSGDATSIKASAGTLRSVHVYNKADATRYVKFHNTAGAPTPGSGVVFTVGVLANQHRDIVFPGGGRAFATGIAMTLVTGIADNDNTGVTAADMVVDVIYE